MSSEPHFLQIVLLALIQGLAELLPISSSAHVIFAEKLMGLDPGAPKMTFLLVMLHTGTMGATLFYFGPRWKKLFFTTHATTPGAGPQKFHFLKMVLLATTVTGLLGLGLKLVIEKYILEKRLGHAHGEVEHLFRNLPMISFFLFLVGTLIIAAGFFESKAKKKGLTSWQAIWIGAIQGLCLPFRGFSRSGATISIALFFGVSRRLAEEFSFALAVVLTPPVIILELTRLLKAASTQSAQEQNFFHLLLPGTLGMFFSFTAGVIALHWLSSWLESGRWRYFGYYCIFFASIIFYSH